MGQDTITIIEPNGVERTRPLTAAGLTIGRGGDNQISLSYDLVSRHHTRISFEQGRYFVTDLGSANGTYLGQTRLSPEKPIEWHASQPLRIGEVTMHLQQTSQPQIAVETGETVVGHFGDDTLMKLTGQKKKSRSKTWQWWLIGGLLALCLLLTAAAGVYYYFYLAVGN